MQSFRRNGLTITLFQKGESRARITAPFTPVAGELVETVEIAMTHPIEQAEILLEMPAENFFDLIYYEVFPALARRVGRHRVRRAHR